MQVLSGAHFSSPGVYCVRFCAKVMKTPVGGSSKIMLESLQRPHSSYKPPGRGLLHVGRSPIGDLDRYPTIGRRGYRWLSEEAGEQRDQ